MADNEFSDNVEIGEEEGGVDEWIITYADMCMLLLVFFILLYSMSTIDLTRFTDSFTSVRQALGEDGKRATPMRVEQEEGAIMESVLLQRQLIADQRKVYSEMRTFMNRKGLEGVIGAIFDEGVITLRLPSEVLFEPGKAEISPEGRTVITQLKDVFIQRNDQNIDIRGFTDNTPPPEDSRFKDNWELSAMRAVNVLRILLEEGVEANRLTATGLADMEPIFPNSTAENRAKNRRVEFVLEKRVGAR
ncbi:OmpA/MotB family protein [Oceanidesulfovibrio indonesiensis]|uniref:OmpA/MotB family protein n=1 Tax=Oceanidesulfovibrio indonesiensis TaxID=54767 RepID=UPI001F3E9AAF|nr:flagellar motor protein MotB [Oceanidesulfovibrio indonesiensis]